MDVAMVMSTIYLWTFWFFWSQEWCEVMLVSENLRTIWRCIKKCQWHLLPTQSFPLLIMHNAGSDVVLVGQLYENSHPFSCHDELVRINFRFEIEKLQFLALEYWLLNVSSLGLSGGNMIKGLQTSELEQTNMYQSTAETVPNKWNFYSCSWKKVFCLAEKTMKVGNGRNKTITSIFFCQWPKANGLQAPHSWLLRDYQD